MKFFLFFLTEEKRPFDFDFFAHLLQKVLAEEEKRKQKSVKNQSLKEKKSSKPRKNVKGIYFKRKCVILLNSNGLAVLSLTSPCGSAC